MSVPLTEEEFSKHVNTKFRVDSNEPIELELTEVKGYSGHPNEQTGMERFSAFFQGPDNRYLSQRTYSFHHEHMGSFDLFLVPISRDKNGFRYEAVFNYFKKEE